VTRSFIIYRKVTSGLLRMPLGAGQRDVLGMVLRQAGRLGMVGLALGLAGSTGVQRLLESIVFEVRADDPVFLLSAAVIVIAGLATGNARTTFAAITGSQWI